MQAPCLLFIIEICKIFILIIKIINPIKLLTYRGFHNSKFSIVKLNNNIGIRLHESLQKTH